MDFVCWMIWNTTLGNFSVSLNTKKYLKFEEVTLTALLRAESQTFKLYQPAKTCTEHANVQNCSLQPSAVNYRPAACDVTSGYVHGITKQKQQESVSNTVVVKCQNYLMHNFLLMLTLFSRTFLLFLSFSMAWNLPANFLGFLGRVGTLTSCTFFMIC